MAPTMEHFLEVSMSICTFTDPLTETAAKDFLDTFSLDFVFTVFQSRTLEQNELQTVIGALKKVLAAVNVEPLLPKLLDYAQLALEAYDSDVKLLGVEQLQRLSQVREIETSSNAIRALFKAFRDDETGVGMAASRALRAYFEMEGNASFLVDRYGEDVRGCIDDSNAVIQMRMLELLADLSTSDLAMDQSIGRAGKASSRFLNEGMKHLTAFDDPLGCLACWEVFAEMLATADKNKDERKQSIVTMWIIPRIEETLPQLAALDPSFQSGWIRIVAFVVGLTTGSVKGTPSLLSRTVSALFSLFEDHGLTEEWKDGVLDCLGQLGRRSIGAEMLVRDNRRAMEFLIATVKDISTRPHLKTTALQSLAMIFDSILSIEAEKFLEVHLRGRDREQGWFTSWLWETLNGALELRESIYTLIATLSKRTWCVLEICRHSELFDAIVNTKREVHSELAKHRYACLTVVATTVESSLRDVDISPDDRHLLEHSNEILKEAVKAGAFGQGIGIGSGIPVVGTEFH